MISGGRKGADILFLKECIFRNHIYINAQFSVPFLSKFIRIYDFGGLQGGSAPLPMKILYFAC